MSSAASGAASAAIRETVTINADPASFIARLGSAVHTYAPHSATALYFAAATAAGLAVATVWGRCLATGSTGHLSEKWIFTTAAAAAPIPTYVLMMILPLDPDLASSVLDDRIVVALAGLYGLVETLKDIRENAASAKRQRRSTP